MNVGKKLWGEGTLYALLYDALPDYRTVRGALDVRKLAEKLGKSHEGVYKWLRTDRIPPRAASIIIELSGGRITNGKMIKFILG
jgi:hypothetical protein